MSENIAVKEFIDLRGVLCPINFIKIKLKLESMNEREILQAIIDDGEPIKNVPRSIKEEGHKIIKVEKVLEDGSYKIFIWKSG